MGTKQSLTTKQNDLYFQEAGSGSPVLLIHGAGAYAGLFEPCIDALHASYRVISYDRRGCSRSPHAPIRDVGTHVADAAHLIQMQIGEPTIVVGWSAGATIALRLALRHPELVASLVLAEPPIQTPIPRLPLAAFFNWELKNIVQGSAVGARAFYRWVSQYKSGGNAFDRYCQEWQSEMIQNAASLFAEVRPGSGVAGEGLRRSDLKVLQMPIQILLGELSAWVFGPSARYVNRLTRQSEIIPIPGAGHMILTDRPDLVAAAVKRASQLAR